MSAAQPVTKPPDAWADALFTLAAGERAAIIGGSGNGKTALSCFLLDAHPRAPVIIYDTKGEPKFSGLVRSRVVANTKGIEAFYRNKEVDYIIVRPPANMINDEGYLDSLLMDHYNRFHGADCYIDELFTFGISPKPRDGMTALITRGRSRGITVMTATQRPAWVPIVCLSEAQQYYVFALNNKKDVKRIEDFIPEFEDTYYANVNPEDQNDPGLPDHGFFFYRPKAMKRAEPMPAIPLDARFDRGYVDFQAVKTRNWL